MQLKVTRSQKTGVISSSVIFCLDARVEFTPAEARDINRYKLQSQIIYTSEGTRRAAEGRAIAAGNAKAHARGIGLLNTNVDDFLSSTTGAIGHGLKAAALGALSAMRLTITIASLQRGQHVECKSLDELLGAEDAILDACRNLRGYLRTASAFDGREVLIDFSEDEPRIVAQEVTPNPQLIAPAPDAMFTPHPPLLEGPDQSHAEYVTRPDRFGLPFDWNDPNTRKYILIAVGIVVVLLLLKACA